MGLRTATILLGILLVCASSVRAQQTGIATGRIVDQTGAVLPGVAVDLITGSAELTAMRAGEVLETVPGMVVSQHSGEGKANQYYLRGFNLDLGTDFASTVAGVPVNMPTGAHAHGYSDIGFLIPELVSGVQFKKGPYFADEGDFSAAGAANINYVNQLERPLVQLSAGNDGWGRVFVPGGRRSGCADGARARPPINALLVVPRPRFGVAVRGRRRHHRSRPAESPDRHRMDELLAPALLVDRRCGHFILPCALCRCGFGRRQHSRCTRPGRVRRDDRGAPAANIRQSSRPSFRSPPARRRPEREVGQHDAVECRGRVSLVPSSPREAGGLQPFQCGGRRYRLLVCVSPARGTGRGCAGPPHASRVAALPSHRAPILFLASVVFEAAKP
ncbi:MAG: hypothetical protein EXQ55_04995 [Acidobacteria bacterium]|nr:hypothetical protein [Acidobacteriota bacterium]